MAGVPGADKMGAMRGCGADVVGLDWHSSIPEARAALGEAQVLQGNVDPMIFFGPEDAIRSAVSACLQVTNPGSTFLCVCQ